MHIGIDQGSGLIRSGRMTPAKVYDSEVADDLICGDERAVYAYKAYRKRSQREALTARGVTDRIEHRRTRGQSRLPHWQTVRETLIGRVRTALARSPAHLKTGPYGLSRMRCRGLVRCGLHLDLAAIASNLRRATVWNQTHCGRGRVTTDPQNPAENHRRPRYTQDKHDGPFAEVLRARGNLS